MIFGRYINKYYLKYLGLIITGIITLVVVDYVQLEIPVIYRMVLTAMNSGYIDEAHTVPFTADVFMTHICLPMLIIIAVMLIGRCVWRICFFGAGAKTEEGLRREMFDHAKNLSQDFTRKTKSAL